MSQPVHVIGPKPEPAGPAGIPTPLGALSFRPGMSIRREWGFDTEPVSVDVEGSLAEVTFHVSGSNEDDLPTSIRVVFMAGVERWMVARGKPIERGGSKVAWSCSATLDLATGRPDAVSCHLSEFAPASERRIAGILAPEIEDAGLKARIDAAVGALLDGWADRDEGYAARIYAAMMRGVQADLEGMAEQARKELVAAAERRDRVARLARLAEWPLKDGVAMVDAPSEASEPERPHVELRGFQEDGGVDVMNLDEIVVAAPAMVHVEMMSDGHAWMGVNLVDGRRLAVNFRIEDGKLKVAAEIDDDGN